MKIGLINPNKEIKESAVHLGLAYIASYTLKYNENVEFKILDTRVNNSKEITNFLNTKFSLIGITASSQVFSEAVDLADIIKNNFPLTSICIGGPHASIIKKEILKNYPFDFAVIGEGEKTFLELIRYLNNEISLYEIKGLIFKNRNGEIVENDTRELIKNLDEIPFPKYELFPMNKYPNHRIITSRGCPFNCVFCNSKTIWTNKWRKRTAENIINEIIFLISKFKRKTFSFNDDCFNIDLKRINKFCDSIMEKKLNIIWGASIRIDYIKKEIAAKMKKSGCYNVNIGIESGNNEVLKNINKNLSKEQISEGVKIIRNEGIDVMGQFMIGNPGDNIYTIKESIDFAKNIGLTGAEFYLALPYPQTKLWDFVNEQGNFLTDKDFTRYFEVEPRIIFETPEFSFSDRLKAIEMAKTAGFYNVQNKDKKSWILSLGKAIAQKIQSIASPSLGNKIYVYLRKIYRLVNLF